MSRLSKIFVAGHRGMVGSAIVRELLIQGYLPEQIVTRSHKELDLTNQTATDLFFQTEQLDQIYLAAAKVGGVYANNKYPAEFIYRNLMIQSNIINSAFSNGVRKLLFLGSSCIYPRSAPSPLNETALLTGPLEPTNEPYAIAKIAGIKLCESYNRQYGLSHGIDYRSVMPTNLYGPGDNYHPEDSHVIPALIRRFHEAKCKNVPSVTVWGSGTPRREFLFVDDMAAACVHVMNLPKAVYEKHTQPMLSHINVGCGQDISVKELAETISEVVGYRGHIIFDPSKPDGVPRKMMNSSRLCALGWRARLGLGEGLEIVYQDFLRHHVNDL